MYVQTFTKYLIHIIYMQQAINQAFHVSVKAVMSMISMLSQNLLIEILSTWINTFDLVSYDTAICNRTLRGIYYSIGKTYIYTYPILKYTYIYTYSIIQFHAKLQTYFAHTYIHIYGTYICMLVYCIYVCMYACYVCLTLIYSIPYAS